MFVCPQGYTQCAGGEKTLNINCIHSEYLLSKGILSEGPAGCVCSKDVEYVSEASGGVRPFVSRGTEEHKDGGWMVRMLLSREPPVQRST